MARLAVLLPGGVATKELLTPLQVVHERLDPDVTWIGRSRGPVPGHDPPMSFHAEVALDEATFMPPPDLLLLPGGFGSLELARDERALADLRRLAGSPTICLAVSTGSLPLAATGLTRGIRVTGHWLTLSQLRHFGAIPVDEPLVLSGRIMTAAGSVSAQDLADQAVDRLLFGPVEPILH